MGEPGRSPVGSPDTGPPGALAFPRSARTFSVRMAARCAARRARRFGLVVVVAVIR